MEKPRKGPFSLKAFSESVLQSVEPLSPFSSRLLCEAGFRNKPEEDQSMEQNKKYQTQSHKDELYKGEWYSKKGHEYTLWQDNYNYRLRNNF